MTVDYPGKTLPILATGVTVINVKQIVLAAPLNWDSMVHSPFGFSEQHSFFIRLLLLVKQSDCTSSTEESKILSDQFVKMLSWQNRKDENLCLQKSKKASERFVLLKKTRPNNKAGVSLSPPLQSYAQMKTFTSKDCMVF